MNDLDIFANAWEIKDDAQRCAYLDEACRDDQQLRQEIEKMLEMSRTNDSFLELDRDSGSAGETSLHQIRIGAQVGPYKLKEKIGEGGMGVVYVAQQTEPIRRRVALKIIKPGMDSRQVLGRFEAERQTLAMMEHPNIARVLDAGTTPQGLPYFAMELVNGLPLTKYCDEKRLTVRQRLELFVSVCEGVQHAHQKGIIHRDLKPSNILVAQYDGRPVPKVIDFGVAKAMGQSLSEYSVYTQLGQILGTLDYMSPEQAQRNQLDIDTRSDIYSLGVVLYELLTGETPFDRGRLREAALDELFRIIKDEEPPKPSTRFTTSASQKSTAEHRSIEPSKLGGLFRGELDWIVMKALEKERRRRYETANSFAQDIDRYLNNEEVAASPPSSRYRFRKFCARNQIGLTFAATIGVLMVLATCVSVWLAVHADRAKRDAELQQSKASDANDALTEKIAELQQARDKMSRMLVDLKSSQQKASDNFGYAVSSLRDFLVEFAVLDLQGASGLESERQRMLMLAADRIKLLVTDNSGQSDLKSVYAATLLELGEVSLKLGQHNFAEQCFTKSAELRAELWENQTEAGLWGEQGKELVRTYRGLAKAKDQSDSAKAEAVFQQAVETARMLRMGRGSDEGNSAIGNGVLAEAINDYGLFLLKHGRNESAMSQFELALKESSDGPSQGAILHNLALIHEAKRDLEKALELIDKAIVQDANSWRIQRLKAELHVGLGEFEKAQPPIENALRSLISELQPGSKKTWATEALPSWTNQKTLLDEFMDTAFILAQVFTKVSKSDQAIERLEHARGFVLGTQFIRGAQSNGLIDRRRLKYVHEIDLKLSELHEADGRTEFATYYRKHAAKIETRMERIPPPLKGYSFLVGGSNRFDAFTGVAMDDEANVYAAGRVTSNADLDPGLSFTGLPDNCFGALVCKYDSRQQLKWAIPLGTPAWGQVHEMVMDNQTNLILTGAMDVGTLSSVQFGTLNLEVPAVGTGPIGFVAKLSLDGKVLWARWTGRGQTPNALAGHRVSVSPNGDVAVGGIYLSDSQFGNPVHNLLLTHQANGGDLRRGFVACFNSAGSVRWVRSVDAEVASMVNGVSCDGDGNTYVCGTSRPLANAKFGQQPNGRVFELPELQHELDSFGFLLKLDRDGFTRWVRPQLTSDKLMSMHVMAGNDGHVYLSTKAKSGTDLDGINRYEDDRDLFTIADPAFAGPPGQSVITRWDPDGNLVWHRLLRCRWGMAETRGVAAREGSGIFLLGLANTIGVEFEGQHLLREPGHGVHSVLIELSEKGELLKYRFFATGIGSEARARAVSRNHVGQIAIVGYQSGEVRFPTGEVHRSNSQDAFVTVIDENDWSESEIK